MRISSLRARTILDSRGAWTVEVSLESAKGVRVKASVPQGKSTGSHEAPSLPAAAAARNVDRVIGPYFGRNIPANQAALDGAMEGKLGGAKKLGANATLAVSIAYSRAEAAEKRIPLWKHLRALAGLSVPRSHRPRLFVNVINGGLHAGNDLDFQEYLVIPRANTIKESADIAVRIYHALGDALARAKGSGARNLGDEGGYAPDFKDNDEPFDAIRRAAKDSKLSNKIDLGMDAAGSDVKGWTKSELEKEYLKLRSQYGLLYIEDPFPEEDFRDFARLLGRLGGGKRGAAKRMLVAGDDLTTTNVRRMETADAEASVNAVIIKPNQIGTVTGALDALRAARKYGWAAVASHRSGETGDDFIADLAFGAGAYGIKLGAPARGERTAKYNRLLEIESEEL